jgi:ribose 5-phosphate isomerase B
MRVHLGSDHAGFELKTHLIGWLADHGYEPVDHGALGYDADDDYPPFCIAAAEAAVKEPESLAVVIGGSGNGEQIAANKVHGARAALAWSTETAALARQHNNAQVVAVGARMHTANEAIAIVETFLITAWSQEARHQRRIDLLLAYEATGENA